MFVTPMERFWDKTKQALVIFSYFQKRNRFKRYGFPILLAILTILIKYYFHPILGNNHAFLLATFVVSMSSWYGGLGSGIFSTILSSLTVYVMFLSSGPGFHPSTEDYIVLGIFIIEGTIISIVSEARFQLEKQKDEFVSFVSHELKNPLATIIGFSGLINRSAKNNGYEKIISYSESITVSSNRILEMINDLLDITKIQIGKFTYQNDIFYLDELTKEVISNQRVITPNHVIKFIGRTRGTIQGDKYRIRQVLINLLSNAIKYSPDNNRVTVRLKEQKDMVLLSVKDHGIGIPMNEQSHIFEHYYRTKNVQRKRSEGLGLGLFIANQIVKHHQGKIWVESKVGKGSTFLITLPTRRSS